MDKFIERIYKKYNYARLTDDGAYLSSDYKKFANYVKKQFRDSANEKGFELKSFNVGHYYFSGFFEKDGKFIYFSYDSGRSRRSDGILIEFDKTYSSFLYRTAKSEADYTGGSNNYTNLIEFMDCVENLFNRM